MVKNMDLFGGRSEAERMKNVANAIYDVVNPKQEEPENSEVQAVTAETEPVEPETNPVVDLVGKAISSHKPRGIFMQTVGNNGKPESE